MAVHFGHMIRLLHWRTDQSVTNALTQLDLTSAQGHIMGYLDHRESPACPKDIEDAFHLSHPTVSGLLARLEKKEFIELRPDAKDRRCKRIYILDKGHQFNQRIHDVIRQNEEKIVEGFSQQEREEFAALLDRAIANMGGYPHCKPEKEERETC